MCDEQFEGQLRSVPTRTFSAEADERILAAIREAGADRSRRSWWRKGVPLWQAAAACLIASLVTWVVMGVRPGPAQNVPAPTTDGTALADGSSVRRPPYYTDISTWTFPGTADAATRDR